MSHSVTPTNMPLNLSPHALNQDLKAKNWTAMEEMMSSVPHLPNVTSLTIDAQWQHLEASIANLIAKCSRLERLSIDISRPVSPIILARICQTRSKNVSFCLSGDQHLQCDPCSNPHCFCHREGGWDEQAISLDHLREGKITGLRPSDDHLSLVRRVIASSPALERMTVELYIGKEIDCSSIPCNRGHWAPCASGQSSRRVCCKAYEWTPGNVQGTGGQVVVYPEKPSVHSLLLCSKTSCVLPRKRSNQDL